MRIQSEQEELFWRKIAVVGEDACWHWEGKTDRDGYGVHRIGKRGVFAHRLAHYLSTGQRPPVVMHTCDNPSCCNPLHLVGGTQRENVLDKVRKDRQAKGSRNGRAKLTEADVREIKRVLLSGATPQVEIARRYGVDPTVIRDIKTRKTWGHVAPAEREDH